MVWRGHITRATTVTEEQFGIFLRCNKRRLCTASVIACRWGRRVQRFQMLA
jgi:hypothetical protein